MEIVTKTTVLPINVVTVYIYIHTHIHKHIYMACIIYLCYYFLKDFKNLFHVYEYTVAVFRHTRRGHQMVESHHVVAGN